jgi:hypothetical protein
MGVASFNVKQRLPMALRGMLSSSCLGRSTSSAIRKTTRRLFLGPEDPIPWDGPEGGFDDYGLSLTDLIAPGSSYRSTVRLLAKSPKNESMDKGSEDDK